MPPDAPVRDPKGLVLHAWNRFYRGFNRQIAEHDLWSDWSQSMELIALEVERSGCGMRAAGAMAQRLFKHRFFYPYGWGKKAGIMVRRDFPSEHVPYDLDRLGVVEEQLL